MTARVLRLANSTYFGVPGDVDSVARRNAIFNAHRLIAESQILREAAEQDGLVIETAFFHFTGEVEVWLE